jgi:hypothetical protein
MPIDVECPTCGAASGESCVAVRVHVRERRAVIIQPVVHLPDSPHLARRRKARERDG